LAQLDARLLARLVGTSHQLGRDLQHHARANRRRGRPDILRKLHWIPLVTRPRAGPFLLVPPLLHPAEPATTLSRKEWRMRMFAQINHMAIISPQYPMLCKFYESVFGLKVADTGRSSIAVSVGDGYVGMTIIPQFDGYVGGLDHFGVVVDDVEIVLDRMRRKHP